MMGTYNDNPMSNSMVYDVQFPDGQIKEYAANIIAQNMYAQVDAYGHHHTLLDSILDFERTSSAVDKDDAYVTTQSGRRRLHQTSQGLNLLISWKYCSEQWVPLKNMKECNPVEVAELAVARGINR